MDFTLLPQLSDLLKSVFSDTLLVVCVASYVICEAIFLTGAVKNSGLKQLLAIAVGGALGAIVFTEVPLTLAVLHGLLGGWVTTFTVGKFKKPSETV